MADVKFKTKNFSNGLYCGAYFKKGSQILNEIENIKSFISNNIENFKWCDSEEDKDGKHFTIMYSKNAPSTNFIKIKDFPSAFDIYFKGFEVFSYGEKHSSLVALISDEDNEFQDLHDYFKEIYNLNPSYPNYTPHITIGVFENSQKSKIKEFLENYVYEHPYDERVFGRVYYILDSAND